MLESDFYLASTEGYRLEQPRGCKRLHRVSSDTRDDMLLVKIEPPLIGQPFGLGSRDINTVLVATRHADDSLFPIVAWPVAVHVARLLVENPEGREWLRDSEFDSIGWGELYPTLEDARLSVGVENERARKPQPGRN